MDFTEQEETQIGMYTQPVVMNYKKEIQKLIGRTFWAPAIGGNGVMVQMTVEGYNMAGDGILTRESLEGIEEGVYRLFNFTDFKKYAVEVNFSKDLRDKRVVEAIQDPGNSIVILKTIWKETEEDLKYIEYCREKGRDVSEKYFKPTDYVSPVMHPFMDGDSLKDFMFGEE